MKKKILLLSLSLLTIVSCASTSSSSSNESSSSSSSNSSPISSEVSSSNESSSSFEEEITKFKNYLKSKEGNIYKRDLSLYNNTYYMTTGDEPFSFHTLDKSSTIRYSSSSVGVINVRNGSYGSLDEDTGEYNLDLNYIMQTYADNKYVYNICDYSSKDETSYYQKVDKTEDYLNEFDLGLTNYISSDFDALLTYSTKENYEVSYENFSYNNGTKDFSFSYTLKAFDASTKTKTEELNVSFEITFKDGYISNAYEILDDALFVAGTKVNWRRAVFNFDYYQGEQVPFEGEVLDYKNYSLK